MKIHNLKFQQAVRLSWERELQIGDPWRIIQLAFGTVYMSVYYFLFVVLVREWVALGKRLPH